LEHTVLATLQKISKSVLDQRVLDDLHIALPVNRTEEQLDAAQRHLAQCRVRKRELYEEYHEGKLDREAFATAQGRLQMEQTALEESAAHLKERLAQETRRQEQQGHIEKLSDEVLHLTAYDPNVIRQLVKEIKVFQGSRIEIEFLACESGKWYHESKQE
jgi:chromosome segregation ATPase